MVSVYGFIIWLSNPFEQLQIHFTIQDHQNESIQLIGFQEKMNKWHIASDIAVFPVEDAHQARPIYEEGLHKSTIIISDFPNYNEFLKHKFNGLVFKNGNASILRD